MKRRCLILGCLLPLGFLVACQHPRGQSSADRPPPSWRLGAGASSGKEIPLIAQFEAVRPERLSMPVPVFPPWLDLEALVPGWVDFSVQIDERGEVITCDLLDTSHSALVEPARVALTQAKYAPVRDPRGVPVRVRFRDRVEF